MSLKGFHIFFIVLAALVSYAFCLWTRLASDDLVSALAEAAGIASGALGAALTVYGVWFYRKSKQLIV